VISILDYETLYLFWALVHEKLDKRGVTV
jgi:hypothetical protein